MGWLDKIKSTFTGSKAAKKEPPKKNTAEYWTQYGSEQMKNGTSRMDVKLPEGCGFRWDPTKNVAVKIEKKAKSQGVSTKTEHSDSYKSSPNSIMAKGNNISISPSNLIGADFNKPRQIN